MTLLFLKQILYARIYVKSNDISSIVIFYTNTTNSIIQYAKKKKSN